METEQLLWIALATIVFVAILRRSTRHAHAPYTPLLPTIEISDPDVARRTLFDHADAFSNHPTKLFPLDFPVGPYRSITTMPYGPAWRTLRCNLTADLLHPTRLSLIGPAQREAVESFVAGLSAAARRGDSGGEVVVLRHVLRHAICALMARLCFGDGGFDEGDVCAIDCAQLEFLLAYADAKAVENTRLPRVVYFRRWRRFDVAFHRVSKIMVTLIAAARRRSRTQRGHCGGGDGVLPYVNSLFDLRLPYDYDGGGEEERRGRLLTDAEVIPLVWEFILAGIENVASCVEWALAHLVARPEVQDKLRRELADAEQEEHHHLQSTPPYLRAVILECLRMNPVVPFLTREIGAEAAVVAAGGAATAAPPTGSRTMHFKINASDMGRNREAWSDPDEFRPDRFLAGGEAEGMALIPGPKEIKMVPFGAGRRYCPGVKLGMLHVVCFLAAAVREFEWAPPAQGGAGAGVDFTAFDMFFSVMKTPLRARITPCRKT